MINIRRAEYTFIILMLVLLACGCGQDIPASGGSATPAAIKLCFAPNVTMQENITDIEITVSQLGDDAGLIGAAALLLEGNERKRQGNE